MPQPLFADTKNQTVKLTAHLFSGESANCSLSFIATVIAHGGNVLQVSAYRLSYIKIMLLSTSPKWISTAVALVARRLPRVRDLMGPADLKKESVGALGKATYLRIFHAARL